MKEDEKYTRREYHYTSFKRSFILPDSANGENIKAAHKNGILNISIPGKEETPEKAKRMIEIK